MPIDVANVIGKQMDPMPFEWTKKDVTLYALGLGVGVGESPVANTVLQYTYENVLKTIPTWGVIPAFPALGSVFNVPGIDINPMMILHGEQKTEILCDEVPVEAKTTTQATLKACYDKGKGALLVLEAETKDDAGAPLFRNTFGIFVRGEGGFGGESGPPVANIAPERDADITHETPTMEHQAIIYRLSGDYNPLHIDPEFAAFGGFDRPILHGLCTYGNMARAVIASCCDNDPTKLASIEVRFAAPVIPGETIVTHIWKESDSELLLKASVKERGVDVVKNARATIR